MEFLEFTNILELDFEVKPINKDFVRGQSFSDYFPEYKNVCIVINNEEAEITTEIKEDDAVFFSVDFQGSGNGGKMFLMVIMIIIITIISYGSMTGPAAAGGTAAEGGAAAGGATMTDITLTGELVTVPATTTASTGLSSSFVMQVGMLAGSMVLNSMLAPKAPDQEDRPPEVPVYRWGDNKTQSKMMIPIPIVLGKFPAYGNLIALRTEPKSHTTINETLIDVGYFQFGLTSNNLTEIDDVILNKMSIKDMTNEDLIAFYTKGTEDQSYLYAIPGANEANGTYRFPLAVTAPLYDNDPLKDNCPLNPGQVLETVLNKPLPFPEHQELGFVIPNGQSLESLGSTLQDIEYWSEGTQTDRPSDNPLTYPSLPYDLFVVGKFYKEEVYTEVLSRGQVPINDPNMLVFNVGDDIICNFPYIDDTYDMSTMYFTRFSAVGRYVKAIVEEIVAFDPPPAYYDDLGVLADEHWYGYRLRVYEDLGGPQVFPQTSGKIVVYEELLTSCESGGINICWDERPDPLHVKVTDDNWETYISQDDEADEITYELFCPQGMFADIQDREDDMDYWHTWVTFEWRIFYKPYNGSPYTKSLSLSGTGHNLWNNPGDILGPENRPILGILEYFKAPLRYSISILDIIEHQWSTVGPYGEKISLIDGVLEKGYYTTNIRINNYGNSRYRELNGIYPTSNLSSYGIILPPDEQEAFSLAHEGNEVQVNQTILYRVKEITYTKNPTYPRTSVLGFSWVASQQSNSGLPQVSAICKNKILVWDEVDGTEEDLANHWYYTYSSNPAYICIDLLFNSYYGAAISGYGSTYDQSSTEFQECVDRFIKRVDLPAFCDFGKYCEEPVDNIGSLQKIEVPAGDDPQNPDLYGKYFNSSDWIYINADRTYYPKRYVCNGTVGETNNIIDWLSKILGSYDAGITFHGARLSLNYDKQYNPFIPLQVFTSSNILADSFKQTFLNPTMLASRIETTFMDEDNQYSKTPVILMQTDGLGIDPNRKSNVNVFGYTQLDRVLDRLDTILRKTNYLNQVINFSTSTQGFTRRVGDPIGVQHEFIEWGVTQDHLTENVLQASGRITKIAEEDEGNGVKFNIYLDRPIHVEDDDVNLVTRYIYLRSLKDDDLGFKARITAYKLIFGNTRVTIDNIPPTDPDYPIWQSLGKYDLFIIGEVDDVYKEAIINDIKFEADNIVTIKAIVYEDAMYSKEDIITDIVGNIFTPAQCKVNNCQIFEEDNGLTVIWEPPQILSNVNVDTNNLRIELVEYRVYRMLQTPYEGKGSGFPLSPWTFVTTTQEPSYRDPELEKGLSYGYKVTTIVSINNHNAKIPLSWNDECSNLLIYMQDYLDPVVPIDYGFDIALNKQENFYDFSIVANTNSQRRDWNNMLLAWILVTPSSSTDWLGPQHIRLLDDVFVGDQFIYVSSIVGLPRNANNLNKVFGLVVINNKEVVFVDDSVEVSSGRYRLRLKFYTPIFSARGQDYTETHKYLSRRYFLGSNQPANSKVVNAHLGFYPILMFACVEDNNLISSPKTNIILLDSIYLYDFTNNSVKLASPNTVQPFLLDFVLNRNIYRTTSGAKNLISYVKDAGMTEDGKISIILNYLDIPTFDLDINYAYRVMGGTPHQIYSAALAPCPETTWMKVVNKLSANKINFTFPDIEIPPGHQVYTALTHIYTIGEKSITTTRGYTSFPVLME